MVTRTRLSVTLHYIACLVEWQTLYMFTKQLYGCYTTTINHQVS